MRKLIQYFIDRSFMVNLISAFVCIVGFVTFQSMNRNLIPPWKFQYIKVNTQLPGASPLDIEQNVTFPIEESLRGLVGVEKISSESNFGSSSITLNFKAEYEEMSEAVELIRSRVDRLRPLLPSSIKEIQVEQSRINNSQFLWLYINGVDQNNETHRKWVQSTEKKFLSLTNVTRVDTHLQKRDLYIEFLPKKMAEYELSAPTVRKKLLEYLSYHPIGQFKSDETSYAIEVNYGQENIDSLKDIPLKGNRLGHSLRLKDIAKIDYRFPEKERLTRLNGKEVVSISLYKDIESDSIDLRAQVQEKIDAIKKELPPPLELGVWWDGPFFLKRQLDALVQNGALGFTLVILILLLFLGWRTAFMTALGLPIAYLGTFIVLSYLGIAIDIISVVGMLLMVGLLVDDAIIVAERFSANLNKGMDGKNAAISAAQDLMIPVTGTILTTVVAFSPILFTKGELSLILFAIPVVVITALGLSWLECFFILPNHLRHFASRTTKEVKEPLFSKVRIGYQKLLNGALKYRYLVGLGMVGVFGVTIYVSQSHLKTNFNLREGNERVNIFAILKESDSLESTAQKVKFIEKFVETLPSEMVEKYVTRIGRIWMDGRVWEGHRYARIRVNVPLTAKDPKKLRAEMQKKIKSFLKENKSSDFERLTSERKKEGNDDDKTDMIRVSIIGGDELDFATIEREVNTSLKDLENVIAIHIEKDSIQDTWRFQVDRESLSRYKIEPSALASQLAEFFEPRELGRLRVRGEKVNVLTQMEPISNMNFKSLSHFPVLSPAGLDVPLSFLGKWISVKSLKTIHHENAERVFDAEIKFDGKKTRFEDFKKAATAALEPLRQKYPNYQIQIEHADLRAEKGQSWALKVAGGCILLILVVLALVLSSLTQPLLVGLAIPFGILGIIWAIFFHGMELGVMSMIGLIGTAGVAVNSSLIMVDVINKMRRESQGASFREILIAGATTRLRPIILTTLTTLGGVFPMAYGIGGDAGFTQPLAFALGWGLVTSTLLTLFTLPLLLQIREDLLLFGRRLWGRLRGSANA